mgnify:CR=1 FL=1
MKVCFKCGNNKSLGSFYKHKGMKDGFLNKCKDCTKKDSKERSEILSKDPNWIESERKRQREKYKRLNYKDKQLKWDKDKPWKRTSTYKNLSRNKKTPKGFELHHWNYNDGFLESCFLMSIKEHKKLHTLITLDIEERIFKCNQDGKYLFSLLDHSFFMIQNGFNVVKI